jgi:hypothetical protein
MTILRKIKVNPIKIPKGREISNRRIGMLLKEMCHVPGQAAAIRFFDQGSKSDYEALVKILGNKEVRSWMDDTGKITWSDYQEWAGKSTDESFLFAVHDSRMPTLSGVREVRGFVNIYSERSEKFRIKRLVKYGLIDSVLKGKHILEVSMAMMLGEKGGRVGTGLMSSALRQSCLQISSLLNYPKHSDLILYAFIDPINLSSVRSFEASGFIRKGKMKYDPDSMEESWFYVIDWQILQNKINGALLKLYESKIKIIREPQKTDSHCGPAVTKALLGFNNIEVSQDGVTEAARVKGRLIEYGMRPSDIARAVTKLAPGLCLWFKQDTSAKDLVTLVKKYKLPVGVNWQGLFYNSVEEEKRKDPNSDHGHYSIVIDIEPEKDEITIDDPYSEFFNISRIFSYRWFKKRWWDIDYIRDKKTKVIGSSNTKKFIFLVAPKGMKLPDSLNLRPAKDLKELDKLEKA